MILLTSVQHGEINLSVRIPEGWKQHMIRSAQPTYGIWQGNKFLMQEKRGPDLSLYDVHLQGPDPDQLIVKYHQNVLLLHISLQGTIRYKVEGIGTLLMHERHFNIYAVPFYVAHVMMEKDHHHSLFLCTDLEYWRMHIQGPAVIDPLLSKARASQAAVLSQQSYTADFTLLQLIRDCRYAVHPEKFEDLVKQCFQQALVLIGQQKRRKMLKATGEELAGFYLINRYIRDNLHTNYSIGDLMALTDLSIYSIRQKYPQLMGVSVDTFMRECKMEHAADLLKKGHTAAAIAPSLGYGSERSFQRAFERVYGLTPHRYVQMYQNVEKKFQNSSD